MKVCLDSNVWVSAFATRGLAADVVRISLAEHQLLVPEVVISEVRRALARKIRLPGETMDAVEQLLRSRTVVAKPARPLDLPVRDPADAWVLASAVAAGADVLVTGDTDLLALGASAPLKILTPRGFWEQLRAGSSGCAG